MKDEILTPETLEDDTRETSAADESVEESAEESTEESSEETETESVYSKESEESQHENIGSDTPQTSPSLSENLLDALPSSESVSDVLPVTGLPNAENPSAVADAPFEITCACHEETEEPPLLWESDILDYGITDGLLFLILVVLILQLVFKTDRTPRE